MSSLIRRICLWHHILNKCAICSHIEEYKCVSLVEPSNLAFAVNGKVFHYDAHEELDSIAFVLPRGQYNCLRLLRILWVLNWWWCYIVIFGFIFSNINILCKLTNRWCSGQASIPWRISELEQWIWWLRRLHQHRLGPPVWRLPGSELFLHQVYNDFTSLLHWVVTRALIITYYLLVRFEIDFWIFGHDVLVIHHHRWVMMVFASKIWPPKTVYQASSRNLTLKLYQQYIAPVHQRSSHMFEKPFSYSSRNSI